MRSGEASRRYADLGTYVRKTIISDFTFWNFTYSMPANNSSAVPNILLQVELDGVVYYY